MPNHLMILAWPTGNGDEVVTSFRYSPLVCSNPELTKLTYYLDLINYPSPTKEPRN
jgi:hypothetical protein